MNETIYYLPGRGGQITTGLGEGLRQRGCSVMGRETLGTLKDLSFQEQIDTVCADLQDTFWHADAHDLPITLLFGHAHDAMIVADGVLVASGTASLEAALLKRPMVITYKMSALTFWLAKRKQYLPYVGLPNILSGKFVVPELLQSDATPENLAQALLNLVANKQAVTELEERFMDLHLMLKQGAADKAAHAVISVLDAQR